MLNISNFQGDGPLSGTSANIGKTAHYIANFFSFVADVDKRFAAGAKRCCCAGRA